MNFAERIDYARCCEPAALKLWGEPNKALSNAKELRWGTHGSRSVNRETGVWFDHEKNKGGSTIELIQEEISGASFTEATAWLRREGLLQTRPVTPPRRVVVAYDYVDESGEMLFQVVRYEPKDFRQRRPDGRGGWIWNLEGARRVLYRLPDLIEAIASARPVFIVEGERDADNLRKLGIPATCNPCGVGKWCHEYSEMLRGADVVVLADNDDAGRKHADNVAAALTGIAARVRRVELAGLPPKGDVSDWIAVGGTAEALWRMVEATPDCTTTPATEQPPALVTVQAATLANKDVPPREWEVKDWIPRRQVTLFAGDGGVGKTILALQYALAAATATSWISTLPREATVLYLGAEDELAELHRRIAAIATGTGVDLSTATCLHLCSLIEVDPAITTFTKTGEMQPTALLEAIRNKAQELAATVIIFDASADFFSGEENDRKQVRRFIAMLRRLGMQLDATIIILSHPSLTGMATGRGYSGTTAWNNSVRARLYLETLKEGDETPDNGLRVLSTKKANYAATGQQIVLEWHNGLFRPQPSGTTVEQAAAAAKANEVFLTLLDRLTAQNREVSSSPGRTYAPAIMAGFDEAKGLRKHALEDAMNRLLNAGTIRIEQYGPPSRRYKKLVKT